MLFGPESFRVRKELRDFFKTLSESKKEKQKLERTAGRKQQETPQLEEKAVSNQTHEFDETAKTK